MNKSVFALTLAGVLTLGSFAMGTAVFADDSIKFDGEFKGAVRSGNEQSGSFVDTGKYTLFEGVSVAKGKYKVTPDDSNPCGGSVSLSYTIKDRNGNSMSFEDNEISCYLYQDGKRMVSISEWNVVDGEGKFDGAAGSGLTRVTIELKTFTYYGGMSGEISLGS